MEHDVRQDAGRGSKNDAFTAQQMIWQLPSVVTWNVLPGRGVAAVVRGRMQAIRRRKAEMLGREKTRLEEWVERSGGESHREDAGESGEEAAGTADLLPSTKQRVQLRLTIVSAEGLTPSDRRSSINDPHCIVRLSMGTDATPIYRNKTRAKQGTLCPVFNETFNVSLDAEQRGSVLSVEVCDEDIFGRHDSLGHLQIPLRQLHPSRQKDEWHQLLSDGNTRPNQGRVHLKYGLIWEAAASGNAASGTDVLDRTVETHVGPLRPLRLKVGHAEPRRERNQNCSFKEHGKECTYKQMLQRPPVLRRRERDQGLCHNILRGFMDDKKNVYEFVCREDKRIVSFLLSSTFTDTEWERNLLLDDVMPYLQEYSRLRNFEIKLVEMRWGIREESSQAHKTSEICMAELSRAQRESQGFSYVFLGFQKYGFRPFPAKIPEPIYNKLWEAAINAPTNLHVEINGKLQSHRWLLDQHFQIDTNSGGKKLGRKYVERCRNQLHLKVTLREIQNGEGSNSRSVELSLGDETQTTSVEDRSGVYFRLESGHETLSIKMFGSECSNVSAVGANQLEINDTVASASCFTVPMLNDGETKARVVLEITKEKCGAPGAAVNRGKSLQGLSVERVAPERPAYEQEAWGDGHEELGDDSTDESDCEDEDEWEGPAGPQYVLKPSSEFGKEWWPRFERLQKVLRSAAHHVWAEMLGGEKRSSRPSTAADAKEGQTIGDDGWPQQQDRGVLRDPKSKAFFKKFFISVTEEEFSRGLLWVDEEMQRDKTLVFRRSFENLETHTAERDQDPASGLAWINCGSQFKAGNVPSQGMMLTNPNLAEALQDRTTFKPEELHDFGIGKLFMGDRIQSKASGLKWNQIEKRPQRINRLKWLNKGKMQPDEANQLKNSKLAEALESKTEFTDDEWQNFGLHGELRLSHWILNKSETYYFAPTAEDVGRELKHPGLEKALQSKMESGSTLEFGQDEWEAFGIENLCMNHFVQAGNFFFKPEADESYFRPAKNDKKIHNFIDMQPIPKEKSQKLIGINGQQVDAEAAQLLREQLAMTPVHVPVFQYPSLEWTAGTGLDPEKIPAHREYLRKFLDNFCDAFMKCVHSAAERLEFEPDEVVDEVTAHLRLALKQGTSFLSTKSCDNILSTAHAYLSRDVPGLDPNNQHKFDVTKPLVIEGRSGSGKTCLLAQIASNWLLRKGPVSSDKTDSKQDVRPGVFVVRFLGTTPSSSSALSLMTSICNQLKRAYGKPTSLAVPTDFLLVKELFHEAITVWPSDNDPLILLIDALDQLDDSNAGRRLGWLPMKDLPSCVRIIVSTSPDQGSSGRVRKSASMFKTEIFCHSILVQNVGECNMVSSDHFDGHRHVLRSMLRRRGRKLTTEQMNELARHFEGLTTPLWLTVVAQTVSEWASFDRIQPRSIQHDLKALITCFFERLCRVHSEQLIRACFAFITIARNGMSETELNHLCSLDDEVLNAVYEWWVPPIRTLPPLLITRVLTDCSEYLTVRGDGSGVQLVSWRHRQFWEAARDWLFKYGENDSIKRKRHKQLADYFEGLYANRNKEYSDGLKNNVQRPQFFPGEDSADRMVPEQPIALRGSIWRQLDSRLQLNVRRLNENVSHLIFAKETERAITQLQDLEYIAAKFFIGAGQHLMQEYNLAIKEFPSASECLRRCRGTIGTAFQDLTDFGPQYLLQLAQCQPNNHPLYHAAQHLIQHFTDYLPENDFNETLPLICDWVNKPETCDPCMMVLRDHKQTVSTVVFSPNGAWFLSASKDQSIRIYDGVTSELKLRLEDHPEQVLAAAVSPKSHHFATAGSHGVLRVLDSSSGLQICDPLIEQEGTVITSVGFSCDGKRLAAAGEKCVVTIYFREHETHAWRYEGECKPDHPKIISSMQWHPSDPHVLLTSEGGQFSKRTVVEESEDDGGESGIELELNEASFEENSMTKKKKQSHVTGGRTATVWDAKTRKMKALLRGHDGNHDCVCFHHHHSGENSCPISGHNGDVLCASWSPRNGARIATASRDRTIRLWDGSDLSGFVKPLWCTDKKHCSQGLNCVSVAPDGHRVASGGDDNVISLWSIENGDLLAQYHGHDRWVYALSWAADSCVLVSGGRDKTVRLWDVTTKESLNYAMKVEAKQQKRQQAMEQGKIECESESSGSGSEDDESLSPSSKGLFSGITSVTSKITSKMAKLEKSAEKAMERAAGRVKEKGLTHFLEDEVSQTISVAQHMAKSAAGSVLHAAEAAVDKLDHVREAAIHAASDTIQSFESQVMSNLRPATSQSSDRPATSDSGHRSQVSGRMLEHSRPTTSNSSDRPTTASSGGNKPGSAMSRRSSSSRAQSRDALKLKLINQNSLNSSPQKSVRRKHTGPVVDIEFLKTGRERAAKDLMIRSVSDGKELFWDADFGLPVDNKSGNRQKQKDEKAGRKKRSSLEQRVLTLGPGMGEFRIQIVGEEEGGDSTLLYLTHTNVNSSRAGSRLVSPDGRLTKRASTATSAGKRASTATSSGSERQPGSDVLQDAVAFFRAPSPIMCIDTCEIEMSGSTGSVLNALGGMLASTPEKKLQTEEGEAVSNEEPHHGFRQRELLFCAGCQNGEVIVCHVINVEPFLERIREAGRLNPGPSFQTRSDRPHTMLFDFLESKRKPWRRFRMKQDAMTPARSGQVGFECLLLDDNDVDTGKIGAIVDDGEEEDWTEVEWTGGLCRPKYTSNEHGVLVRPITRGFSRPVTSASLGLNNLSTLYFDPTETGTSNQVDVKTDLPTPHVCSLCYFRDALAADTKQCAQTSRFDSSDSARGGMPQTVGTASSVQDTIKDQGKSRTSSYSSTNNFECEIAASLKESSRLSSADIKMQLRRLGSEMSTEGSKRGHQSASNAAPPPTVTEEWAGGAGAVTRRLPSIDRLTHHKSFMARTQEHERAVCPRDDQPMSNSSAQQIREMLKHRLDKFSPNRKSHSSDVVSGSYLSGMPTFWRSWKANVVEFVKGIPGGGHQPADKGEILGNQFLTRMQPARKDVVLRNTALGSIVRLEVLGRTGSKLPVKDQPTRTSPPSGLKWIDIGFEKPTSGDEIDNANLATALENKTEFTMEELSQMNVSNLSHHSYIKANDTYFKPAVDYNDAANLDEDHLNADRLKETQTWANESQAGEKEKKGDKQSSVDVNILKDLPQKQEEWLRDHQNKYITPEEAILFELSKTDQHGRPRTNLAKKLIALQNEMDLPNPPPRALPPGVQWQEGIGKGKEIKSEDFAKAFQKRFDATLQPTVVFPQRELNRYNLTELRYGDYIKVRTKSGSKCFKPTDAVVFMGRHTTYENLVNRCLVNLLQARGLEGINME